MGVSPGERITAQGAWLVGVSPGEKITAQAARLVGVSPGKTDIMDLMCLDVYDDIRPVLVPFLRRHSPHLKNCCVLAW